MRLSTIHAIAAFFVITGSPTSAIAYDYLYTRSDWTAGVFISVPLSGNNRDLSSSFKYHFALKFRSETLNSYGKSTANLSRNLDLVSITGGPKGFQGLKVIGTPILRPEPTGLWASDSTESVNGSFGLGLLAIGAGVLAITQLSDSCKDSNIPRGTECELGPLYN